MPAIGGMGMKRPGDSSATAASLVLEVPAARWQSRLCWWADAGGPALLLSLPRGLFTAHDEAMQRIAGFPGRPMANDVEYLTAVWGLASGREGEILEIPEVPLVQARVGMRQVALELSGWPWLVHEQRGPLPQRWVAQVLEEGCMLGLAFDLDLEGEECEEVFFDRLADGRAALGQVQTGWSV